MEQSITIKNLCKSYGQTQILKDISFEAKAGRVTAFLGPNGAGKTTLFNLLTGVYEPSEGTVTLDGHLLNGKQPYKIASLGLSRTFQNIRLFKDLTVLENVLIAFSNHHKKHVLASFFRLPAYYKNEEELETKAMDLLKIFELDKDEFNITIMLIEHDMNLVMEVTERIYVLEYGRLIAHGTPEEIKSNKRVIEAYLGGEA